jgi:hypothetical protein
MKNRNNNTYSAVRHAMIIPPMRENVEKTELRT